MEEYDINEFISVLYLKNMLLTKSDKQLVEFYSDYHDFLVFLNSFIALTNIDSGFLLLNDNILDRINAVIQVHRYDEGLDIELFQTINDVIIYLNSIKSMSVSMKKLYVKSYINYNEEVRNVSYLNKEQLYNSLLFDAVVVIALRTGNFSLLVDEERFLVSLNYLMYSIPELFEDDDVKLNVNKIFEKIENNNKSRNHKYKKYVKVTKGNYSKLVSKEE